MSKPLLLARQQSCLGPKVPTGGLSGVVAASGLQAGARVVVLGCRGIMTEELGFLTSDVPKLKIVTGHHDHIRAALETADTNEVHVWAE
jgi:hypothetical protein